MIKAWTLTLNVFHTFLTSISIVDFEQMFASKTNLSKQTRTFEMLWI